MPIITQVNFLGEGSDGDKGLKRDYITEYELYGTLIDILREQDAEILSVTINRSLEQPITASLEVLTPKKNIELNMSASSLKAEESYDEEGSGPPEDNEVNDLRELVTLNGSAYRITNITKKTFKVNEQSRTKDILLNKTLIQIELEFFYEVALNKEKFVRGGLDSYTTLNKVAGIIPIKGGYYKYRVSNDGEYLSPASLLEKSIEENGEWVKKSNLVVELHQIEATGFGGSSNISVGAILSEITVEENQKWLIKPPVFLEFDQDKDGTAFDSSGDLGETLAIIVPFESIEKKISYGDKSPTSPPTYINYLQNTSLNHDISGETKTWITEEYIGKTLIKKQIKTYGFAYLAIQIKTEKDKKPPINIIDSANPNDENEEEIKDIASFWTQVEEKETFYEYTKEYYTGSYSTGWKLERFEIEFPINKKPPTLDIEIPTAEDLLFEEEVKIDDVYLFTKIPFIETEKLELVPYLTRYKDIDPTDSLFIPFKTRGGFTLYGLNIFYKPDMFINKTEKEKYGVEGFLYKDKKGYQHIGYKGAEEKETQYIHIQPSSNTIPETMFELGSSGISFNKMIKEYLIPKNDLLEQNETEIDDDHYISHKHFFSANNGASLYANINKQSSEVVWGRPPQASYTDLDVNKLETIPVVPQIKKQKFIINYPKSPGFGSSEPEKIKSINPPPVQVFEPTVFFLNYGTPGTLYVNAMTKEAALKIAENLFRKETLLGYSDTISFSVFYNPKIEEGMDLFLTDEDDRLMKALEVTSLECIVRDVNHEIEWLGTSNGMRYYKAKTNVTAIIRPKQIFLPKGSIFQNPLIYTNFLETSLDLDDIKSNIPDTEFTKRGTIEYVNDP